MSNEYDVIVLGGGSPGEHCAGALAEGGLRATLPIGRVVGPAEVAALPVHLMTNTALTGDLRHRRRPAAHLADNVQTYSEDSHDAS